MHDGLDHWGQMELYKQVYVWVRLVTIDEWLEVQQKIVASKENYDIHVR